MRAVEVKLRTEVVEGEMAGRSGILPAEFEFDGEYGSQDVSTVLPPMFAIGTREIDTLDADTITDALDTSPAITLAPMPSAEATNPGVRVEDVAAISHDLKSPLATIALEVSVIQESLPARSSPDVRRSLARIERNVAFIDHMVHDLLDLASIDARRFQIRRAPTDIGILLVELVERIVATRDRERLYLDVPGPIVVLADAPRIERVVTNLIHNAFKYAPRGSPVIVRMREREQHVRISVVDHGPGLTPEESRYVFDKFRRTRSAESCEGTGLGLYVSRKIIEAHGGRIGVDSVIGSGSSFYFELPLTAGLRA